MSMCSEPVSFEHLLKKLFETYDLRMTFEQHALVGSTVRSYLTYLTNEGRLHSMIENNLLMWEH